MAASTTDKIKLGSSDSQVFEVDEEVANMCQTVKGLLEDATDRNDLIPLPNVSGKILARVIEFCRVHVDAKKEGPDGRPLKSEEDVKAFDTEMMKVEQRELFDIILAANYLNIEELLKLTVETVAGQIKGKTPQQIREAFHIKNDFTPEEEAEVMKDNQWSFD